MSVRSDGSVGTGLKRTTSLFDTNAAYTAAGWFYLSAASTAYDIAFSSGIGTGASEDFLGPDTANAQKLLLLTDNGAGSNTAVSTAALATSTWYYAAMIRSSATAMAFRLYDAAGVLIEAVAVPSFDVSARAVATSYTMLQASDGNGRFNGRVGAWKAWTAALTAAEVQAEQFLGATAARAANLHAIWPLQYHTSLTDVSGNAKNWTGAGTLSTEADPPGVDFNLASAALTGTAVGGITESDIVTGGKTIIIDLIGTEWIP